MDQHLHWTPEEYERYQSKHKAKHRWNWPNRIVMDRSSAFPFTNVEPSIGDELLATQAPPGLNRPVSIVVYSYRHRLADSDGLCGKYVVDAIISTKSILPDDSPEYVESVTHKQVKIGKGEQEKTVVEIWGD